MALYRDQGIVLRTYKLGETDRIVHLLSQGRGKVRAVAKGVRRPGSRFGGRLEPFSHVDLQLYEGRNLDIIGQAELITPFAAVREDWIRSACGSAVVEAADQLAQMGERSNPLFLLVLDTLRVLAQGPAHPPLVLDAYLFRLASVAGYHPYLDACASCGAPGDHGVFHIAAGGALCQRCAPPGTRPLAGPTRRLLSGLLTGDMAAIGNAEAEPRTRRAAGSIVHAFLSYHLERPLKSWDLVPR
jgi:DNA repair protein RecO (recombination protein O)